MIKFITCDDRSDLLPAGFFIDEEYVSHQIHRLLRDYTRDVEKRSPRYVEFNSTRIFKNHSEIAYTITVPAKTKHRMPLLQAIVSLTFRRKVLEDRGIFVGSYILNNRFYHESLPHYLLNRFHRYTQASCGAYKITEQADTLQGRDFSRYSRTKAKGRNELSIGLLVSGASDTLFRKKEAYISFRSELASSLFEIEGIRSISIIEHFLGKDIVSIQLLIARNTLMIHGYGGRNYRLSKEKAAIYFESIIVGLLDRVIELSNKKSQN